MKQRLQNENHSFELLTKTSSTIILQDNLIVLFCNLLKLFMKKVTIFIVLRGKNFSEPNLLKIIKGIFPGEIWISRITIAMVFEEYLKTINRL